VDGGDIFLRNVDSHRNHSFVIPQNTAFFMILSSFNAFGVATAIPLQNKVDSIPSNLHPG
jgi:hypothetical protein